MIAALFMRPVILAIPMAVTSCVSGSAISRSDLENWKYSPKMPFNRSQEQFHVVALRALQCSRMFVSWAICLSFGKGCVMITT